MKFNNGFWLTKDGYKMNYPEQAYRYTNENNVVRVLAPCKHVDSKGDTMNWPALTFEFSSPKENIIKVRMFHYMGCEENKGFDLALNDNLPVDVFSDEKALTVKSGKMSAVIGKDPFTLDFFYDKKRLTGGDKKHTAYINGENNKNYFRTQFDLDVDESVYGLGERFTEFVKNGQVVDTWNEDGGTCSEQAYKNIPFYVTNRDYGIFVNHTERVSFEVGSEVVSRVGVSVCGEELDYFVIGGDSIKDVIKNYTALTGRPALPPAWSFGLWLTTSFTTSYDEKTVTSFVDGMAKRDIPLSVFHFDCYWMKEFNLCDFEWDERVFPNPEEMLAHLKAKGLHICVWLNSYVGQNTKMFREGKEKGYFIKKTDGSVWQWDLWEPGLAIVDFSNPDACKWYKGKLEKLLKIGVDCFKADFGERIPFENVKFFDGTSPEKMHNYYTYLYNKTVFDAIKENRADAVVFSRSATVGCQKFPVHWGGDCTACYQSMAETLRGGLSLGMGGFGFWSHDISGFENTATPDLYKRWAAFGLLSSHSRLHGSSSYRVPWLFDEEAVDVVRFFTKLKCSLMPYIFAGAYEAVENGTPLMRAMVMEFENDPICKGLDKQYMLGSSLLVAPIFNDRSEAQFYLPQGKWYDFFGKKIVEGGKYITSKYDYMSIPLFIRENSIVAFGAEDSRPDYDFADGAKLFVSPLLENKEANCTVYNKDGVEELKAFAVKKDGKIIIKTEAKKQFTVVLLGVEKTDSVCGAKTSSFENGVLLTPEKLCGEISVNL